MNIDDLGFLRLLQLADSALPIGATAHSFGLETLAAEGQLTVAQLGVFLQDYLQEVGSFESFFCRRGHALSSLTDPSLFAAEWLTLNADLSAYKSARESRTASATLGRRLLQLVQSLHDHTSLPIALQSARDAGIETHYSTAFGLVGASLGIDEHATTLAYLHQTTMSLISACQRMLPLGQSRASALLWQLKPTMLAVVQDSEAYQEEHLPTLFTPLCELGSMRHPDLTTRLFIS
ncbi:MAG TPA: urease accessory UreF family protein [Ktedonobacteraceae bacterium]|jgi:urease accessory protein|nr:urease accessory UreF family protein [Ktedonobacteraceae bacterium]